MKLYILWWDRIAYSQYSNSLQAGWSRHQIPVRVTFSTPIQTGPGAHPASYTIHSTSFLGGRGSGGRGVALTTHPHLVQRIKKEYSYTSTPSMGLHDVF